MSFLGESEAQGCTSCIWHPSGPPVEAQPTPDSSITQPPHACAARLGQDCLVLYSGDDLTATAVRLTAPDIDAVRSIQPDPHEWGRWLEAAISEDAIIYFSIETDDRLVGEIFVHDIVPDRSEGMVGYHIFNPAERGQGIGRAALDLLLSWVTRETGIHHLFVITREDNDASRRLVEGAGFSYVGPAREDANRVVYEWRPLSTR